MFGATASTSDVGFYPADAVTALLVQIHNDLRAQHPDWIESNGNSPMCDFYEVRLVELLEDYAQTQSDESAIAVHRALEEQANA